MNNNAYLGADQQGKSRTDPNLRPDIILQELLAIFLSSFVPNEPLAIDISPSPS